MHCHIIIQTSFIFNKFTLIYSWKLLHISTLTKPSHKVCDKCTCKHCQAWGSIPASNNWGWTIALRLPSLPRQVQKHTHPQLSREARNYRLGKAIERKFFNSVSSPKDYEKAKTDVSKILFTSSSDMCLLLFVTIYYCVSILCLKFSEINLFYF